MLELVLLPRGLQRALEVAVLLVSVAVAVSVTAGVVLLWVLLFQSMQYGDVRVVGQYRGLFVAPYHHLAQKCIIGLGGCRVAGEYGLEVSFGSGGPDIGAAQVLPTYPALRSQLGYARLRWKLW